MGLPKGPLTFDASKVGTVRVPMGEPEGYRLTSEELKKIFAIDPERFGHLPKRIVVPVLEGSFYVENWYSVKGWLYQLEPVAWIPQVARGACVPISQFKTEFTKETTTISETTFNASASANLTIEAGGSYMGVTASLKVSSELKVSVSKSQTVNEKVKTHGEVGNVAVQELYVYPLLKCKILKKQRIDYTINDSSKELKWTSDSYNPGYWDQRWVGDGNLGELKKLAWHPVPMTGEGLAGKATLLAAPQNTPDGDIEITTVITRQGWVDWYHYDVDWQTMTTDEYLTLAVPKNTIAFQPAATWATLEEAGNKAK